MSKFSRLTPALALAVMFAPVIAQAAAPDNARQTVSGISWQVAEPAVAQVRGAGEAAVKLADNSKGRPGEVSGQQYETPLG